MTDQNSRLSAIRTLLDDENARNDRKNWEVILTDKTLIPGSETELFQKQFYDLLLTEMEEGYQRNDKLRQEKRRKTGRSSGYIPPQMRITSTIGRYLFAYFKWHKPNAISPSIGIETKGLEDIAEAFGFRIDPLENQRQFMKGEERQTIIDKENDRDYNTWLFGIIITAFAGAAYAVYAYMRRHGF